MVDTSRAWFVYAGKIKVRYFLNRPHIHDTQREVEKDKQCKDERKQKISRLYSGDIEGQVSRPVNLHHHVSISHCFEGIFFFCPMPPRVLVDIVVLPLGHGSSVTDFWGWDTHEAQLCCPDNVSGDIGGWSARRALNLLAPELFFLISAHHVYKMWIIQEPNMLELWNKLHFEEEKTESIYHV